MTMFWEQAIVFCGKCMAPVEEVTGFLKYGKNHYGINCHGQKIEILCDTQEKYRVNGPVPDSYLFWANGQKRINKKFKTGLEPDEK
jgi:hypothetical protein